MSGHIVVQESQGVYLKDEKSGALFRLLAARPEAHRVLSSLRTGDLLHASGKVIPGHARQSNQFHVDTIGFVGLTDLLGYWIGEGATALEFKSFSEVVLYTNLSPMISQVLKKDLKYSLAPSPHQHGEVWRIFFTDDSDVEIADIQLRGDRASLQFFDPRSGQSGRRMEFSRSPREGSWD